MPYSLREFSFSTSLKFFLLFTIIITLCCLANSNMRCDSLKSLMIINKLS
ncbi:hypothetical protein GO859_11455, partial [Acinetobacter baumannii]|nr:hypothetical protein [Acinetobacter baumannii]